jgi:hypothetical protein
MPHSGAPPVNPAIALGLQRGQIARVRSMAFTLGLCSMSSLLAAVDRPRSEPPLRFETAEQVVMAGFLPRPFIVDFVFTVEGDSPVTLGNFSTSCPCTSVALERRHYYPGQKGVITSLYEYRGQENPEVQVIEVWTEGARRPQLLRIVPQRPAGSIWAERSAVRWLAGNIRDPQSFDVEVATVRADEPPRVEVTSSAWRAELHRTEVAGRFRITVTPMHDAPPAAQLVLRTDDDGAADTTVVELIPPG